ncbi:MAG: polysaccharide deacetylase family protein [Alphaproteobacteria bacterium]|nr:polysaccharide deacetylase family protein [Alphaproteobacteria bacterium]
MTTAAYAPSRDLVSKVRRRLTQHYAARPATLSFAQPVLSITFDDFPASAADAGARVLEHHGARGTYYTASGMAGVKGPCGVGYTAADITRLVQTGHEIGCHTSSHADCARQDIFSTLEDLARNRDALMGMGAPAPRTHAFPYGETSGELKNNLPPRFMSARGILPGLNIGRTDLTQLRAYPLFGSGGMQRVSAALKAAAKRKAWVIAFTHDVSDTPSDWGTRADELDALLHEAHQLGFVILPVTAALERRLA